MNKIMVYHKDFAKTVLVKLIPRMGDWLVIDGVEYEVQSIVIDTDEHDFYLNLK